MLTDSIFVPLLQPDDWEGRRDCLCRRLVETPDKGIPLVAYGIRQGDEVQFVSRDEARESGWRRDDLERQAVQYLIRRPDRAPWRRKRIDGDRFLVRDGDYLTSADILSQGAMQHAQKFFGESHVFIGVPTPHTMLASNEPRRLIQRVRQVWNRATDEGEETLSPLAFFVQNGVVSGVASFLDDDFVDASDSGDAEVSWVRKSPAVSDHTGPWAYVISLECEDIEELLRAMTYELDASASVFPQLHVFDGLVLFRIEGDKVSPTRSIRQIVDKAIAQLNTRCRDEGLATRQGQQVVCGVEWSREL